MRKECNPWYPKCVTKYAFVCQLQNKCRWPHLMINILQRFLDFPYYHNLIFIDTIHAHSLLNLESMTSPSTSPFTKRGVLIELNFIGMFYNNAK